MLHAFAHQEIERLIAQGKRDKLEEEFDPPDDGLNENFFFFLHDRLKHASGHLISLKRRQYPSHRRFEALEQTRVYVVRIKVGQFDRTAFHLQFLAQRVCEARERKFAGRVVGVALAGDVTSNRVDVAQVEAPALN